MLKDNTMTKEQFLTKWITAGEHWKETQKDLDNDLETYALSYHRDKMEKVREKVKGNIRKYEDDLKIAQSEDLKQIFRARIHSLNWALEILDINE
jgi:hypothetical protein